jgi:hypothetical protein
MLVYECFVRFHAQQRAAAHLSHSGAPAPGASGLRASSASSTAGQSAWRAFHPPWEGFSRRMRRMQGQAASAGLHHCLQMGLHTGYSEVPEQLHMPEPALRYLSTMLSRDTYLLTSEGC